MTYLKCQIRKGWFKSERFMVFKNIEGQGVLGIVSRKKVKPNRIKVHVMSMAGDKALVRLPGGNCGGQSIDNFSGVWVFKKQLVRV